MNGIVNNQIIKHLKDNVDRINRNYDYLDEDPVLIDRLNFIFEKNSEVREESRSEALKYLDKQISTSNLLSACLFLLAISVYSENEGDGIFPKQWITYEGRPNPKHVFGCALNQLCSFSISIVELAEKGLDNAARVVLRSFIELSWQTIILLYFREDLKKYIQPEEQGEVNRVWCELFGRGKVQKKLAIIEENLGFDADTIIKYKEYRKDIYQFFSESVHHGHINNIVSSMICNFGKETFQWKPLGGAGVRSDSTLFTLTLSGLYFLDMFFIIIEDFHGTDLASLKEQHFKDCLVFKDLLWGVIENRREI
jgi:hypothetical protein